MNLREIADSVLGRYGYALRKVGAEWHSASPCCGHGSKGAAASDRFVVFEKAGEERWWCRSCDKGGDAVSFLRTFDGIACPEAHLQIGKPCDSADCPALGKCAATRDGAPRQRPPRTDKQRRLQAPEEDRKHGGQWQPAEATTPAEKWHEKAAALVDKAHEALLDNPEQLAFLAARGIPRGAVEKFRLGWLEKDLYRDRESWGLEPHFRDDHQKKKLWLPRGIVIPAFNAADGLFRIRIRRPQAREGEPRYYWVPGSSDDTWIINPQARAFAVVESDLDGVLIAWHAGDLVGVIPLGTCSARPRESAAKVLDTAVCILNALDFEPRVNQKNGKHENPGGENWLRWWKPRYPQAKRHPAPGGKDPGEAFQAGTDIRAWIIAGLPAGLRPAPRNENESWDQDPNPKSAPPAESKPAAALSAGGKNTPETSATPANTTTSAAGESPAPVVHRVQSADGRTINVTDDRREYIRLRNAGSIVFNSREIEMLRSVAPGPEEAKRILDIKEIFRGHIVEVGPDTGEWDEAV